MVGVVMGVGRRSQEIRFVAPTTFPLLDLPTHQPEADAMASTRRTAYVPQSQRHTARLDLRVSPDLSVEIRADADRHGLTLAQVVEVYRDLALASGRLEAALAKAGQGESPAER